MYQYLLSNLFFSKVVANIAKTKGEWDLRMEHNHVPLSVEFLLPFSGLPRAHIIHLQLKTIP